MHLLKSFRHVQTHDPQTDCYSFSFIQHQISCGEVTLFPFILPPETRCCFAPFTYQRRVVLWCSVLRSFGLWDVVAGGRLSYVTFLATKKTR